MASKKILVNVDMQKNQLENAVVHKSSTAPSSPTAGQIWYDSGNNEFKYYDGSQWVSPATTEGHVYALSGSGTTVKLTQDSGTTGNAGTYTIPAASGSNDGTMSSADYTKLQGIATGATANTGTVTSIATSGAITGGTITTSGTITHSTAAGYKHVPSGGSSNQYLKYSSAGTAAWQSPVTDLSASGSSTSTDLVTAKAVYDAIDALPEAMVFKGTVGTNGTYTSSTLPAAAAANTGWTVKVITDGTYQSVAAKAGDTLISDGSAWILIPSGDEPAGTVTNIATSGAITGGPITSTGTISHSTSAGYKHIPTGGASGNALRWSASGTAVWESVDTVPTASSTKLITSGAVSTAIGGIATQELISRATITIGTSTNTGTAQIGSGYTIYAVTAIQGNAGVVADWSYSGDTVTVTLAANPSSAVTVNILYYKGGTVPTASQAAYVVEENSQSTTNEKWKWRKWSNGEIEVWGRIYHYNASFTATGNGYFSPAFQETFPTGLFVEAPFICIMDVDESTGGVCGLEKSSSASSTKTQQYWAYRVEGAASVTFWTQIYAKGRWQS